MSLYQFLYSRFVETEGIHYLLRFYIFVTRIHDRMVVNYGELVSSLKAEDCAKRPDRSRRSESEDQNWDWRGFPEALPFSRAYNRVSTSWMVYSVAGTVFKERLSHLIEHISMPLFGLKGNCLRTFRIITHMTLKENYNIIFPAFHLAWRLLNETSNRQLSLTMVIFMLQTDKDIGRFMELYRSPGQRPEYSRFRTAAHETRLHMPRQSVIEPTLFDSGNEHVPQDWTPASRWRPPAEKLIRYSMCYQVHYQNKVYFRIRPNRTEEARAKLKHAIARVTTMLSLFSGCLALMFATHLSFTNPSDKKYVLYYPGCNKRLDEMSARGELPAYSCSNHPHHLLTHLADAVSNAVLWLDNAVALFCVPTFCYLLNFDLLLYCSGLDSRLGLLLERVRRRRLLEPEVASAQRSDSRDSEQSESSVPGPMPVSSYQLAKLDQQIDKELHELYFQLNDFIREIGRADQLVSDVLTLAVVVWFVGSSLLGVNFLLINRTYIPLAIQILLAFSFAIIAAASHFLLTLHRRCQKIYKNLCSIMAMGPAQSAERFLVLMDFFTRSERTTYTLARSYPYKSTTFIIIVGYSGSCFMIGMTLFGGDQPIREVPPVMPSYKPADAGIVLRMMLKISGFE